MPSSILIGAATAGAGALANKFLGPKRDYSAPLTGFAPAGINAGGLTSGFDGRNLTIAPSAERLGMVRDVAGTFSGLADEIGSLRPKVAPGFSDLRASRLQEIENARRSSVGNLRDNLERRRVLGSSFGQDAITRAEAEFGQSRDRVAAESFLQELEMTNQLIQQEYGARRAAVQTGLDELNLEADVATKLAARATDTLGANARLLAELTAKEAAGAGKFFGDTFSSAFKDGGSTVRSAVNGFFGGGGSPFVGPVGQTAIVGPLR